MADKTTNQTTPNPWDIGLKDLGSSVHAVKVWVEGSGSSGGSTITGTSVTVAVTATLLKAANAARKSLIIRNNGATTIFIGPSGVTTANGFPLAVGEAIEITNNGTAWYGIVAAGTENARVLEDAA